MQRSCLLHNQSSACSTWYQDSVCMHRFAELCTRVGFSCTTYTCRCNAQHRLPLCPLQPSLIAETADCNTCVKHACAQDDSSLTRSNQYLLKLFETANLQVLLNVQQKNFPKEIFKVRMYALRPRA